LKDDGQRLKVKGKRLKEKRPVAGCWVLDAGLRNKGTGLKAQGKKKDMILDAGFWMLD